MHSPEETASAHAQLVAEYGDRFLVGIGASHAQVVDTQERPATASARAMVSFLDGLDSASPSLPL